MKDNPFVKPKGTITRFKGLVYGATGVRKTRWALSLPNPVVLDMEKGTTMYSNEFNFEVKHDTSADGAIGAVDWLLTNKHNYKTLVIDPCTVFWSALQDKWANIFLKRKSGGAGNKTDFYEIQIGDWGVIKRDHKAFMRKVLMLDMNVVFTAHEANEYAEGAMMKKIGVRPDCEKNLPYDFDFVLRFYKNNKDETMVHVDKDRSYKLPKQDFLLTPDMLNSVLGKEVIEKQSEPVLFATDNQLVTLENLRIELEIKPEDWAKSLSKYDVQDPSELTADVVKGIIDKLESAAKKKRKPADDYEDKLAKATDNNSKRAGFPVEGK